MKFIRSLFIVTAVGALAFVSQAEDLPDHNLSEFRVGNTISGEKVDLSKLKGKVVAIEYWGTT